MKFPHVELFYLYCVMGRELSGCIELLLDSTNENCLLRRNEVFEVDMGSIIFFHEVDMAKVHTLVKYDIVIKICMNKGMMLVLVHMRELLCVNVFSIFTVKLLWHMVSKKPCACVCLFV